MAIRIVSPQTKATETAVSAYTSAQDEQLILLLQGGDDRAFEALLNRHRGLVWRVAKQYLGTLQDAEDLFQDVSLSFYQNRHSYQMGAAKFSSWLYRVASNRCLDIVRSRKDMNKRDELNEHIPSMEPTGEDTLNRGDITSQLQALLDVLPAQQKLALSLYYYEEKDISDISLSLSVTEGAARALIKRGRDKIRELGSEMFA